MRPESRALGSAGVPVTRIGLGLAALGRPAYINLGHGEDYTDGRTIGAMRQRCVDVLNYALWAAGVRYVDAARSYGKAEEFLAHWLGLRRIERKALTIGSKWGYTYVADWQVDVPTHEVKDHSVTQFRSQWAASQALLDPWITVYQIHSATLETGVLGDPAVLAALEALREDGVTIGVSVSGPQQAEIVRRAANVLVGGMPLFGSVQATWNVLEPSAGPALAEAHDAGLGIIVKEGVANGRLTARGDSGVDDATALAAALAQPWADCVLSGAATVGQFESNLAALDVAPQSLDWDRFDHLAETPADYWSRRATLPWN